jgi:DNA-binding transcriptional LysR family regulator
MLNKLEMLRIFCVAAETSSFKEAAIRLGISPQAVGRAVKELEEAMGEVLFFRNTRHSQITEQGITLAQKAQRNITEIDDLFRINNTPDHTQIKGLVRIAAPTVFSQNYLTPLLTQLLAKHPELQLQVLYSDEISDVVSEKIDIGIRAGMMRDSQLVAKTVSQIHFYIVGAATLIERVGEPTSLEALANKPITLSIDAKTGKPWPWFLNNGDQWHPKEPALATSAGSFELDAVLNGSGFGQIASFLAIPHLKTGHLKRVLPELTPEPWNVYVYRSQKNTVAARIRVVFDWLVQGLSDRTFFPVEQNNPPTN